MKKETKGRDSESVNYSFFKIY